ncbi:MAG: 4-hydroxythreonine-4-phosphate dehydrogenase PdxA [Cyclobacteriaceae bacterium]
MIDTSEKSYKPVIGISIGDYNGIGPEVIIKTFSDSRMFDFVTPVVYGDGRIFSFYRKQLKIQGFNYNQTKSIEKLRYGQFNIYNFDQSPVNIQPGIASKDAGEFAINSLEKAVNDLKEGHIQALVTAPLNKDLVQAENFKFPGHTEYLTQQADAKESLMFLVAENLRIGVVTGHIPLSMVSERLTKDLLTRKIEIMLQSLKKDFGIKKPRVAVLGLNPHAGENGLLGLEEKEIIDPVIENFKNRGDLVLGSYPSDGFFGNGQFKNFDGILGMYHDQGLIPFKNMAFEEGVNYTAGLSFIRTSPDHGTAFNIAGKGIANEASFRSAVFLAIDIIKHRLG